MELVIVAGDGLMRAASRLAASLPHPHESLVLTASDFDQSAPPAADVGVLTLGEELVQPAEYDDPAWEAHGVRWGVQGRHAWIAATVATDPTATLADLEAALSSLKEATAQAPQNLQGLAAGASYLDPTLVVPAQTVVGERFSFTPERMCWERQYTVGILDFLCNGFDDWIASILS